MKYFKLFFLLAVVNLSVSGVSAQSSKTQSVTVAPSLYPDTVTQPSIVIGAGQEKNMNPGKEIHYESKTVVPESKLSIGRASVITMPQGENSSSSGEKEKVKVNYSEQKVEKQELPVNSPSLNPK